MKVQVNDAERSQKELLVEIPYEVFETAADKELDTLLPTDFYSNFFKVKIFIFVKLNFWENINFCSKSNRLVFFKHYIRYMSLRYWHYIIRC